MIMHINALKVEMKIDNGETKKGRVVQLQGDKAIIQVFESTTGMSLKNTTISFTGKPLEINLSKEVLGREFNGIGEPIDCLTTLIRGQKLLIFSGNGMTHNELAAQIVRQAKIGDEGEKFAIVFAAMGIKHDDKEFFRKRFEEAGVIDGLVMFTNLADDPIVERITTPRVALTTAEYLAFEEDELSSVDKIYMEFGRKFESRFLNQGFEDNRSIDETLEK